MAIYWPTQGFKGRTFKLCVLTRWDFNFYVRSFPLRGKKKEGEEEEEEKEKEKKKKVSSFWRPVNRVGHTMAKEEEIS